MFKNIEQRGQNLIFQHQEKLAALQELNISLGDKTTSSSHIIVTYPPKQILTPFNNNDIILPESKIQKALYVHIPFCSGICTYCNYARTASGKDDQIDNYLSLLEKESSILKEKLGTDRIPIESIYIGGGTPTLLSENQLARLFYLLAKDYDLKSGAEYSLEGSPETITKEKIEIAKAYGINRISIGIESFNDKILQNVMRRHTAESAKESLNIIKETGIENIDVDLIRGLPGYDRQKLIDDLKAINELQLPSITSYQYVMKERSIDYKRQFNALNESQLHHAMFLIGMEEMGYKHAAPIIDCYIKDEN
ncbi:MAG: radical SAM protein, partial [Alphaproteobacteria bacterium]